MATIDNLQAAAKAVIEIFKAKGLAPEAMKSTSPATLVQVAGISAEEAENLFQAWTKVVQAGDVFGRDFSVRLVDQMGRQLTADTPPPAPAPKPPRDKERKDVPWPASPVEKLSFEELVFSLLTREVQHRRLDVRPWILSSKARKAAYAVKAGLKNDLSSLRSWTEREVQRIDTSSLVQDVLEEMGYPKEEVENDDFVSICRSFGNLGDMDDEDKARAKIRAIAISFGLNPKETKS